MSEPGNPMTRVAAIQIGIRTIMGTNHPIETVVYRNGPRQWVVAYALCNGVPSGSEKFHSRHAAFDAAGISPVLPGTTTRA